MARWLNRIGRRLSERLWLSWVLLCLVWSPAYKSAQYAVRKVARDQSIRGMAKHDHVLQQFHLYPGRFENIFRRCEGWEWTGLHLKEHNHAVVNWRRELLVEMAYLALKERGK